MAGDGGFVDSTDIGGIGAAPAEDFSAPAGSVPVDPLSPAGAPATPAAPAAPAAPEAPAFGADLAPPSPGTGWADYPDPGSFAGPSGDMYASPMEGNPQNPADTTTPAAGPTSATAQNPALSASIPGTQQAAADQAAANQSAAKTADRLTGGTSTANAGNAFQQLDNALRGMQQAAAGGNPQAQQVMNMLRQMMQQAQMQQMMGQGGGYNPYMNQMFNQNWMARMRMQEMRRRFMERQREHMLRPSPGTAAAMNPPTGGRRGR